MVSTADVRPIDDVARECRAWLWSKGSGTQERRALGAAFSQAYLVIQEARGTIEEFSDDTQHGRGIRLKAYGEAYAATKVIRAIADEIGVSNFL